jgi:methylated-DNA-protein-cysteine methyltransferase-like protein
MAESNKYEQIKQKIYNLIKHIPEGKVVTYGQLSKALGINSPQLVGRMLHENKAPKEYPCHRVVFADGSLSEKYAYGGEEEQMKKLKKEGVKFSRADEDKVDMKKSLYVFPFRQF